jgi:hypothetical protein
MYTSDKGSGAAAMPANIGDGVRRTRRANGTLVTAGRLVTARRSVALSGQHPELLEQPEEIVAVQFPGKLAASDAHDLLVLAPGLAPAELAGGFALPDVMPLVNRIEQSFVRRLESLPAPTRRLLLIAAAKPEPTPGRGSYGSMCVPRRPLRVT